MFNLAFAQSPKPNNRDLAARNVLLGKVDRRYVAKLADFGLSRTTSYLDLGSEPRPHPQREASQHEWVRAVCKETVFLKNVWLTQIVPTPDIAR